MENKNSETTERTDIRSSVTSYWDSNKEDRDFLVSYIKKNQTGRILYIVLSVLVFTILTVCAGFILSALVRNGLGHGGYYIFIFVYVLFVIVYWLIFRILFIRMDFRGNTRNARRFLSNPTGKEDQIRSFIDIQKSSAKDGEVPQKHVVRKLVAWLIVIATLTSLGYYGYSNFLGPFINYNKGKNSMGKGNHAEAIESFMKSRGYKNTDELLSAELQELMDRAKKYDSIVSAYNNTIAARSVDGDIYYQIYSQIAFPDIGVSNAENFIMLPNYIVAVRSDGAVSYSQYTYSQGTVAPDVSSWTEIVSLQKINSSVVGYQKDGTMIYSASQINQKSLDRLSAGNITGIYDKLGLFGVRDDGTVSVPDPSQFSYTEKAKATIDKVSSWENISLIKGDIANFVLGLTKDGYVLAANGWFIPTNGETNVSNWSGIVDIACGESHSVGLRYDGTVVATGSNSYGQCEVSEWEDVVAIECGNNFTIGIRSDGSIYITGQNNKAYIPRGFTEIALFEKPEEEIIDDQEEYYDSSSAMTSFYVSSEAEGSDDSEKENN